MDSPRALTAAEENAILLRVHRALHHRDPNQLGRRERWRPGGILDLREQLLRVIRKTWPVVLRDPRVVLSPAGFCEDCFYLAPCGYCPHRSSCVLYEHADLIGLTIFESLKELASMSRGHDVRL